MKLHRGQDEILQEEVEREKEGILIRRTCKIVGSSDLSQRQTERERENRFSFSVFLFSVFNGGIGFSLPARKETLIGCEIDPSCTAHGMAVDGSSIVAQIVYLT